MEISGVLWRKIQHGAKKRKLSFNITIEELWTLYLKQNKCCALTGEKLYFDRYAERNSGNISLDRIDSNNGYTIDNVQWTTKNINIMKREINNDKFKQICQMVTNFIKDK